MRVVEATLILAVATFHLAVVAGCVGSYEFMPNAKDGGSLFKERKQVTVRLRETVGELKAVVCLNTFHSEAMMLEECICLL